tara:strand:+ start:40 stop:279 length:240 start_codon:yes stop_codon:yes gene_type:complete
LSEKSAKQNVPLLALPLYGRKAPKLDLAYSGEDLKYGRHHKNLTTSKNNFKDISADLNWVKKIIEKRRSQLLDFVLEIM